MAPPFLFDALTGLETFRENISTLSCWMFRLVVNVGFH